MRMHNSKDSKANSIDDWNQCFPTGAVLCPRGLDGKVTSSRPSRRRRLETRGECQGRARMPGYCQQCENLKRPGHGDAMFLAI